MRNFTIVFSILFIALIVLLFPLSAASQPFSKMVAENGVEVSCRVPSVEMAAYCLGLEEKILDSTIRIRIEKWRVTAGDTGYSVEFLNSHATVKDGRFLVTHNHFRDSFSENNGAIHQVMVLLNSQGEELYRGSLSDFEVVLTETETLVLAAREAGFFERLGVVSADFGDGTAVSLEPGMEVAQVDWDGERALVAWQRIESVEMVGGVPVLMLSGEIMVGASGGGVFVNGVHVANNWSVRQMMGAGDEVLGTQTKVALNSKLVVDPAG